MRHFSISSRSRTRALAGAAASLLVLPLLVHPAQALGSITWAKLAPAAHPSARYYSAMAYDPAHSKLVLFGGKQASAGSIGETWTWNGSNWAVASPATSPGPRHAAVMAYDPVSGKVIMFGGCLVTTGDCAYLDETWSWDGSTWTDLTSTVTTTPASRGWAGMVEDPVSHKLLMYGGYNTSHGDYDETWQWSGTDWTLLAPAHSPGVRDDFTMVADPAHSRVVLYGGYSGSSDLHDTWTWNGTDWTQATTTGPSARVDTMATYDPRLGRVVMFGGYHYDGVNDIGYQDTYSWSGTAWSLLAPTAKPTKRDSGSLAYFPPSGQTVLFGGFDEYTSGTPDLGETWLLKLATGASSPSVSTTASATASFTVSWLAPGVPTQYVVQYANRYKNASGVWATSAWKAWKTVSGATHSAAFTGVQGTTYLFHANAVYSGGASSGYSPAVLTVVPYDDRASAAVYSTGWVRGTASGRFLGTYTYTTGASKTMTIKTDVLTYTLIGDKCPTCGKMRVYVDGVLIATVDTYKSTTAARQVLFSRSFTATKPHQLKVVTLGTAGRPKIAIDAISVRR
jgi:hypothetical protein